MKLALVDSRIVLDKELTNLDKLVLRFTHILEKLGIGYVIISGYIAILFGRSRHTEDVDLFIEEMPFEKFEAFWAELEQQGFECIITSNAADAYHGYLKEKLPLRFAEKGFIQPNFELKFPKTKYNYYSMEHKVEVCLEKERLWTSELELQIAFKLYLGSDKDFEDARHLYIMLKDDLDADLLRKLVRELGVEKEAGKILWKRA